MGPPVNEEQSVYSNCVVDVEVRWRRSTYTLGNIKL
jgi:hypothetical protein